MKEHYSKRQLEEVYNCEIFKTWGIDNHLYWVANGLNIIGTNKCLFNYADGLTLGELHKNIREVILYRLAVK